MKLLLLDVGNSRLKWALLRGRYRRGQPFAAQGAVEIPALRSLAAWSRLFKGLGAPDVIWACNVAGVAVERRIRAACQRAGLPAPQFARSQHAAAGVRNAYRDTWRLGADRWVGLIGARHEHPGRNLCIVGLGTAMTIDLLDALGRHRGGCMVPGPRLMIESLLERTAGIRRRAGGWQAARSFDRAFGALAVPGQRARSPARAATLFARDTHGALVEGSRHACAALIEHALSQARTQLGRQARLIVAGGATDAITPLLKGRFRREDDLVLRGLAVLAADAAAPDRITSSRA
ncbi:MAG: type III pantothenate kinase [Steroidobacterales bacterium]